MKKQFINEVKRMQQLAGIPLNESEINWALLNSYVNELSKQVVRPDLFKNNFIVWEDALFYNYDEAIDKGFIEGNEISKEEFNELHNMLNNNFNFNYFVRNWTVLDDEESRHEDDKDKNIEHFKTTYNVDDKTADIMKKIVDTFIINEVKQLKLKNMKKQFINEVKQMQKLAGIQKLNEASIDDKGNLQDFDLENDLIVKYNSEYYKNENLYKFFYCEKGLADGFDMEDGKKVKYIVGYSRFLDLPDDKKWIFGLPNPEVELKKQSPDLLMSMDCFDAEMDVIGYIYSKSGKDIETEYSDDDLDDAFIDSLKN
jgi:hypothetical protein